jgi:thiosulfate dehydrogenase
MGGGMLFWLIVAIVLPAMAAILVVLHFLRRSLDSFRDPLSVRAGVGIQFSIRAIWVLIIALLGVVVVNLFGGYREDRRRRLALVQAAVPMKEPGKSWQGPSLEYIGRMPDAELIFYGFDLIRNTQDYFGEYGLLRPGSINRLNCQSCHLDAGTRPFGNNYFAVQSTYPQWRARSGSREDIPRRVNDCFQRSLNGSPLEVGSREMRAILSYIRFLGLGVPAGVRPDGSGLKAPALLSRAADPERGQVVYNTVCASCHGVDGRGLPMPDGNRWYPPLWGPDSYNAGAGLFRLSRFAAYVKYNMPLGVRYTEPRLSDEEAWDVAAYVNCQERPDHPFIGTDWPDSSKKPYDHPFGPFRDTFSELQHKLGPFKPIIDYQKRKAGD